ncbi:hypothetical protein AKO1_007018 [Acrasis kona]|uniref:Uncharacterized protein n=1 Tax=Acrasis kona TaxID=1008807 RepID=A0AAW2YTB8_9EUKA
MSVIGIENSNPADITFRILKHLDGDNINPTVVLESIRQAQRVNTALFEMLLNTVQMLEEKEKYSSQLLGTNLNMKTTLQEVKNFTPQGKALQKSWQSPTTTKKTVKCPPLSITSRIINTSIIEERRKQYKQNVPAKRKKRITSHSILNENLSPKCTVN